MSSVVKLLVVKRSDLRDGDSDLDMHGGFVRSMEPEMKAGAVQNSRGNGDPQPARHERVSAAVARPAEFRPRLAAAAALGAGGTQQHRDRHDRTAVSLVARQTDFGPDRFAAFAGRLGEERSAHTGHQMGDRRKIDRDLIREAIVLVFQTHAG